MKVRADNPTLIVYKFISFQAVCLSSLAGRTKRFTAQERNLSCRNASRRPVSRWAVIVRMPESDCCKRVSARGGGTLKAVLPKFGTVRLYESTHMSLRPY